MPGKLLGPRVIKPKMENQLEKQVEDATEAGCFWVFLECLE